MTPDFAQVMARYNRWMNEKLYGVAERLGDEERKLDRGAFFGSIHRTFNHLLVADRIWMSRFTGIELATGELGPGITSLDQELHRDFDALRNARAETDSAIEAYCATLTPHELAANFRYLRLGKVNEFPLWQGVGQIFNHQTHHRGQLTTLFMQAGHDPGVTDLWAMLRA